MPPPSPPPPLPPSPPAPPGSPPTPPSLPVSDCFEREWVDVDTPPEACSATSERDGRVLSLVFSDEFEVDGRTFADGQDSRWTAIDHAPITNEQINYYNSSLAHTAGGKLRLVSTSDDAVYDTFSATGNPGGPYETRHLQTAMLQGWNKFCFSEGIAEVSTKMPGEWHQAGLWPAFWLMGNLGRATYTASTEGIWPWIFNESTCVSPEDDVAECDANQCTSQRISACNATPGFGLNAYQGRGAPEIDVIEVQPGNVTLEYDPFDLWREGCAPATAAARAAVRMQQPFISTSLQAAPGFPNGSLQRPADSCLPQDYTTPRSTWQSPLFAEKLPQWCPELASTTSTHTNTHVLTHSLTHYLPHY